MKSIKDRLGKINSTINEFGDIPMAYNTDSDKLEALDKEVDAWYGKLCVGIKELEGAIFGSGEEKEKAP